MSTPPSAPPAPSHLPSTPLAPAIPAPIVLDLSTAVDATGLPLQVGATVSLIDCVVVGLRPDAHNRFNVYLLPKDNTVVTINKDDILNGATDGKTILVCGYHCIRTAAAPSEPAGEDALALAQQPAVKPTPDPSVWNLI